MNLARFLGRWGSLQPFMTMKSSSFSLLESEMKNLGRIHLPRAFSSPTPQPNNIPLSSPPPPPPFPFSSCPAMDPLVV